MRSGVHIAGLGCRNSTNCSLAAAGLILLWIFLCSSHLGSCHSLNANQHYHMNQQLYLKSGHDQLFVKFSPRKLLRVFQQKVSGSSNAAAAPSPPLLPPEQSQFMNAVNGNGSEVVYEDDKRRVHTGPNPLHN